MKARRRRDSVSMGWMMLAVALVAALIAGTAPPVVAAMQIDIIGPAGSGRFGACVAVLPNGNIVVTDPDYDAGATADVGAVYLYDGTTQALISVLTGSTAGDQVGGNGVTALGNGNYVVGSPLWDNGTVVDAGAVTWGSGTAGVGGVVSATNSLVGGTAGDQVGSGGVVALSNGHYVVMSAYWDNGAAGDAGAVTWGNGATGVSGVVSAANSLVGSTAGDQVGYNMVTVLSNGNYVVQIPNWDNGAVVDAGAATWGSGTTGISGAVSAANSLVGSAAHDRVGGSGVVGLSNGNYVVMSAYWDDGGVADVGAVTWGNGATGVSGLVSAANSLVGSAVHDWVGHHMMALSNGNYVVDSPYWDNGAVVDAGAVTWGNGTTGTSGVVSAANSLVGSVDGDHVGRTGVTALSNGNYVVHSPLWDNGAVADAGAVTWGDGTTGIVGAVSVANSLVGSTADDQVGGEYWGTVIALSNGHYVVGSRLWDNGALVDAGAATWGNGMTGVSGPVSAANSLVGSTAGEMVGDPGTVTALSNGNYVVSSPLWDDGAMADVGAVAWGDGTTGVSGLVPAANSLVGSTAGDRVGQTGVSPGGVTALSNGHYVVLSAYWDNGAIADAGAVTWADGTTGTGGVVSAANSLVGSTAGDQVGGHGVTALSNGHYVVISPLWDSGGVADAGATTWGNGTIGTVGAVSAVNSLVGSTAGDEVSFFVMALDNGDYIVHSPYWDNGAVVDAGAVTWGSGLVGVAGPIEAENSVRGTAADGGFLMGNNLDYDYVNDQLVVGRPADNMVTLFRPFQTGFLVFVPVILKNGP